MKKYKSCLVYDYGTFVSLAIRLSQDFENVYYHNPHCKSDYTKTSELNIGDGFEEIKWVENFWFCIKDNKPEVVIFTGVRAGDLQEQLIDMGIPVWGSREAECMEIYRWDFLEYQEKIGLPTPKSVKVKGIAALREMLYKSNDTKWIKLDANERGNIETFRYIEPEATELSIILPLEQQLGSAANIVEFIVQDPIEAIMEDGSDPFTIDGQFPDKTTYGFEAKDAGWIGKIVDYEKLPEGVKFVNAKLVPALKKYGYRGQMATEIKETADGKSYLIDFTARMPYPPTNCVMDNWTNMAECIYEGARGNMIQPIYEELYMCEIILYSDYAKENDYKLVVPKELEPFVKRPYCYKGKSGSIITVPQSVGNTNVGSVVSREKTAELALKVCLERVKQIDGHGLHFEEHCLDEALQKLIKI